MVNTVGLDKADVLAVLYNASRPQGMGFMHYDPKPMTKTEAEAILKQTRDFDYLKGRVMKLNLSNDLGFEPWGYDRDNGDGAAQRAIDALKKSKTTNNGDVASQHENGVVSAANEVMGRLREPTIIGSNTVTLGLSDVADDLSPKIDQAVSAQRTKSN